MSVTLTFDWAFLWGWLAVGLIVTILASIDAWRSAYPQVTFVEYLRNDPQWAKVPALLVVWPLLVWEWFSR